MAETTQVMYSLKELAELLVKERGFHEGHYELSIEFQVAIGAFGPTPDAVAPSALLGVSKVGISKVPQPTPLSINAATVSPAQKKPPKSTSK